MSRGVGGREESELPPDTWKMHWDDRKMLDCTSISCTVPVPTTS